MDVEIMTTALDGLPLLRARTLWMRCRMDRSGAGRSLLENTEGLQVDAVKSTQITKVTSSMHEEAPDGGEVEEQVEHVNIQYTLIYCVLQSASVY